MFLSYHSPMGMTIMTIKVTIQISYPAREKTAISRVILKMKTTRTFKQLLVTFWNKIMIFQTISLIYKKRMSVLRIGIMITVFAHLLLIYQKKYVAIQKMKARSIVWVCFYCCYCYFYLKATDKTKDNFVNALFLMI